MPVASVMSCRDRPASLIAALTTVASLLETLAAHSWIVGVMA
jgi:hypothetical protein